MILPYFGAVDAFLAIFLNLPVPLIRFIAAVFFFFLIAAVIKRVINT